MIDQSYLRRFLLPALLLAAVYACALAAIVQYAFRTFVPGSLEVGPPTLHNLARLVDPLYARVFGDSLLIGLYTAAATLLVGYPLAYALVRTPSRALRSALFVVAITPLFTGEIVRTYAWLNVLGANGFINRILLWSGLIGQPLELMFTTLGVCIALVHFSLPVMVMILAAALAHVDPRYERAAATLGAGPLRRFALITLPLSMPGVVSGFVTIFAWTLSAFATPQLIGGGRVTMISNLVYQLGFASFNFPFAAALSLAAILLTVLLLALLRWSQARVDRMAVHA
ncbi:putative spermidine/putrescine transport system permease protein [Tistlia consotensis]|uniref:Putative spermidine/putrescine transport system permease protein n=1 Tax=Tistlia consotensis USBA 355 TaxID=560819 RepID=A0A1Y6C4Z9_9PROT|nr:ABC transporter permease [Tistlia consotensis]SMF37298.1 putative spermidine/putrescine transport system permease protein [Tistlia consotensis USBA 355]SNR72662.1 putative spermidine/putrescine transport system permease protein [Tistlia consotensis]